MPLQIRRGPSPDRLAMTPLAGELIYDTTTQTVYVGNGTTAGGLPVTSFSVADARTTTAKMFLGESLGDNSVHTGITFQLVNNRLIATVAPDLSNYIGLIVADQGFKGNLWADDSGILVDSASHTFYGSMVAQGDIVPDANEAYDLGSNTNRFKDLYLSGSSLYLGNAVITATDTAVNLPLGSTVGGNQLGINEGDTYNITITGNVVATDSTVLVNSTTGQFNGDLYGSVFGFDSSILVDARDGVLRGQLIGNVTGNVVGDLTGTASVSTLANNVNVTTTTSSAAVHYLLFASDLTGSQAVRADNGVSYLPSTNTLATGTFQGNFTGPLTGNVFTTTIDSADSSGITVIPALTLNSDLTVENELAVGGAVTPILSETHDLGSYTKKFRNLYLTESSNALWIGNAVIGGSGSAINLPAGSTVGGSPITTAAGSNASTITVNSTGTNADHYVSFFDAQSGDKVILTDDTFKYNPGTGILNVADIVAGSFTGNVVGNTSGIHTGTVIGELKGSVFADDSTILVDAVDGVLRGTLVGNVTGNVTGNLTGSVGSLAVTIGSTTTSGQIRTFSNIDSNIPLLSESFHNTVASNNHWRWERARGTATAPTAVQVGDVLGSIRFAGYDGTAQQVGAILRAEVGGGATSGVTPGAFRFLVTGSDGQSTTALLIGATRNVTVPAGSLTVNQSVTAGDGFNTGFLRISDNKIATSTTNADIEFDPNGTGTVDFVVPSQTTVGPAGIASALPATPSTYFKIKVNGVEYVVPAYAVS